MFTPKKDLTTIDINTISDNLGNLLQVQTDDDIKFVGDALTKVQVNKVLNDIEVYIEPKYQYAQAARFQLQSTTIGENGNELINYYDGVYDGRKHFISLNSNVNGALIGSIPNPTVLCYAPPVGYKWVAEVSANMNLGMAFDSGNLQPFDFSSYVYIVVGTGGNRDYGSTEQRKEHPKILKGADAEYHFFDVLDISQNATTQFQFYLELYIEQSASETDFSDWFKNVGGMNITNLIVRVNFKLIKIP